ncbi:hypothetical protein ACLUX9_06930 [Limosilactobacillus reuteri subsp. suis]|uniref:hypothetical protein n=1 Tax=Limosilactobacillus reuteri TaxID=1598 RepID=UPI0039921753
MATSEAQKKAKKNYEKANPEKAYYWKRKSEAGGFINPSPQTRLYKLIQSNIDIRESYIGDLKEFKIALDKRLKEL